MSGKERERGRASPKKKEGERLRRTLYAAMWGGFAEGKKNKKFEGKGLAPEEGGKSKEGRTEEARPIFIQGGERNPEKNVCA